METHNSVPWPIKRSSHSMSVYMNRFLVLIGGETCIENSLEDTKKPAIKPKEVNEDKKSSDDSDEDGDP